MQGGAIRSSTPRAQVTELLDDVEKMVQLTKSLHQYGVAGSMVATGGGEKEGRAKKDGGGRKAGGRGGLLDKLMWL